MTPAKRNAIAYIALATATAAALLALGGGIIANQARIDDITKVRAAVCNLRADQVRRIHVTQQFLDEHPEGFTGIPPALLRRDLRERQKVVDALAPLRCH